MPTTIGPHLLGRRPVPDALADQLHDPARQLAAHPAIAGLLPSQLPHALVWIPGAILDQGDTPECTAYASRAHVNCQPHAHPDLGPGPDQFYQQEKAVDGLPAGEDGSTTQAAALILQRNGLLNPPLWVHEEWTVRKWILTRGPVQVGTDWWQSMFDPDAENIVHVDAQGQVYECYGDGSCKWVPNHVAGGHEYLIVGYDYYGFGKLPTGAGKDSRLYKLQNSWGTSWGEAGFFYLSPGDLAFLLTNGDGFAAENWDGTTPLPPAP